jgi:formiminoglutamate deiminase
VSWHAEWAWVDGSVQADVLLSVVDGRFASVAVGVATPPADAVRLAGLTLPGLVNAHSHAFHRALRGRTHGGGGGDGTGDFWTWRDRMYAVASVLDPDLYLALARACYAEMALAGTTSVGEFHYLHHGPGGVPYDDPNAMASALRSAAAAAGIRLTLLDTLYLQGDVDGRPLSPVQERFSDGSADAWASRVESLSVAWKDDPLARIGTAVHSVRAVDPASMSVAVELSDSDDLPLHAHVSEQPAEVVACQTVHRCSPVALLQDTGVLSPRATAVHATHVDSTDIDRLARSATTACLCPTTERDLADGIGPARRLSAAGVPLALGSDSHAVIDLFEEARGVELDERLADGTRGGLTPGVLLAAATSSGARSIGWPETGRLAIGAFADFVTVSLDSVRLAGAPTDDLAAAVTYAATASDVTDVVVAGRPIVESARHLLIDDVPAALSAAIRSVFAGSRLWG